MKFATSKIENPDVARVFENYPVHMRDNLLLLRELILETASETEGIEELEETLRWGEPSYLTKSGSTIRIDWKKRTPDRYAVYFICTTSLVGTFKDIYGDLFTFEDNRAIVFGENDQLPVGELKHCISLALSYHRVKHLPLLGAWGPGYVRVPPPCSVQSDQSRSSPPNPALRSRGRCRSHRNENAGRASGING